VKKELGCVVCGAAYLPPNKHQAFIQMHHLEPMKRKAGGKRKDMGNMGGWTHALEMAKCVPVCKHCHAKIHNGKVQIPANVQRFTPEEIYERRFVHGQRLAPEQPQYKNRNWFDKFKREKAQRLYEQTGKRAMTLV